MHRCSGQLTSGLKNMCAKERKPVWPACLYQSALLQVGAVKVRRARQI